MSYDQLQRQTRYLAPFVNWSVRLVLKGPRSVPIVIRRVPLSVATSIMSAHVFVWRVFHG